jgi:hypothetical protein
MLKGMLRKNIKFYRGAVMQKIFIALILGIFFSMSAFATDENGVETHLFATSNAGGKYAAHYVDYNPTSTTFVGNQAGGTSTVSGKIDLRDVKGSWDLHVALKTLGSTNMTMLVEGMSQDPQDTTWGKMYTKIYTVAEDEIIPIGEKADYARVTLKISGNGTDTVSVFSTFNYQGDD